MKLSGRQFKRAKVHFAGFWVWQELYFTSKSMELDQDSPSGQSTAFLLNGGWSSNAKETSPSRSGAEFIHFGKKS
jgi:hypothetical protein